MGSCVVTQNDFDTDYSAHVVQNQVFLGGAAMPITEEHYTYVNAPVGNDASFTYLAESLSYTCKTDHG